MHATTSLDYRIHQMQLGSPRSSLNCQALSVHLPHPNFQTSRSASHLPSPMSAPPRPQLSQSYQKAASGSTYLTSPTLLSSPRSEERALPTYQARPVVQRSYESVDDGSRSARNSLRLSTSTIAQNDDSNDEMSLTGIHLALASPGVARRAKAHVPSACVNCKRKHLACETRRPCNRCLQAGKEATCVDVQHKKRGRPRLRDEETGRGVTYGGENSHPHLYPAQPEMLGLQGSDQRAQPRTMSYREIRSHADSTYGSTRATYSQPLGATYSPAHDLPPYNQSLPETNPTALLTLDFVVLQCNRSFSDALSLRASVEGRPIRDLMISPDREKCLRLQNSIRAEAQEKAHLPIRSSPVGSTLDILSSTSGFQQRPEYWTFRLPNDQSRGFPVSISLARTTAHFLVLTLVASSKSSMTLPSSTTLPGWAPSLPSPVPIQSMRSPGLERHSISQMSMPYQTTVANHQPLIQSAYRRSPPQQIDSGTSPSTGSASTARSSLRGSDVPRDNLRHFQLPPIRTSDIGNVLRSGEKGREGKGSSSKGSPQSAKRKKRRRVDIGEMLR